LVVAQAQVGLKLLEVTQYLMVPLLLVEELVDLKAILFRQPRVDLAEALLTPKQVVLVQLVKDIKAEMAALLLVPILVVVVGVQVKQVKTFLEMLELKAATVVLVCLTL
jgi:hypothetical protein